ncbi:hypothetical protein PHYPO_G00048720 [Pangasianodon hypophthalmus]|uniref:Galectin n=1 Tax=Pangasianodon hypophthalmus TaxID=310915 RepID=A0A5N5MIL2_PANHP|nr:hypothetical protein PHYPO_G00048720 [Pangasianodon hypophthalmus]
MLYLSITHPSLRLTAPALKKLQTHCDFLLKSSTFIFPQAPQRKVTMSGVIVQNMSFKPGQTLTVTGVPNPDSTNFAINIGNSPEELALHLNPRFSAHGDNHTVVCNSYQGGSWCQEHRPDGFPFNQGEEFKIWITFTHDEFKITLPDNSEIHFPNRPGAEKYNYMLFEGGVRIHSIEIK